MLEQLNQPLTFTARYTVEGVGKPGLLDVKVDVYDPAFVKLVSNGATTALGAGFYRYTLASGSVTLRGEYVCVFKTADATVDCPELDACWVVDRAGVGNLDAPVSSRPTAAQVAASVIAALPPYPVAPTPPTTAQIATAVVAALPAGATPAQIAAAVVAALPAMSTPPTPDAIATAVVAALGPEPSPSDIATAVVGAMPAFPTVPSAAEVAAAVAAAVPSVDEQALAVELVAALPAYPQPPAADDVADAVVAKIPPIDGPALAEDVWSHDIEGVPAGERVSSNTDPLTNQLPGPYRSGTVGAALSKLAEGKVTITQVLMADGQLLLTRGDDYLRVDNRAIEFIGETTWPTLTDAAVHLVFGPQPFAPVLGTVIQRDEDATPAVRFELTAAAHTGHLDRNSYRYSVVATLPSGHVVTVARGSVKVTSSS